MQARFPNYSLERPKEHRPDELRGKLSQCAQFLGWSAEL